MTEKGDAEMITLGGQEKPQGAVVGDKGHRIMAVLDRQDLGFLWLDQTLEWGRKLDVGTLVNWGWVSWPLFASLGQREKITKIYYVELL